MRAGRARIRLVSLHSMAVLVSACLVLALAVLMSSGAAMAGGGEGAVVSPQAPTVPTSPPAALHEQCKQRSTEACYSGSWDVVTEWRAKALAWDRMQDDPPIVCIDGEGTGSKITWATVTAGLATLIASVVSTIR